MQSTETSVDAIANSGSASSITTVVDDPDYVRQWHLHNDFGINLRDAWTNYSGAGVRIAVVDDGFQYTHPDLVSNYDINLDHDWRSRDADAFASSGERHGTAIMGIIGAALNGFGTVGVAYQATLTGLRIGYGAAGNPNQYAAALRDAGRFDVVNMSWGYATPFADDFGLPAFAAVGGALRDGAAMGRGGLGSVFVLAAGNERAAGGDAALHGFQNAIETIVVAATDAKGQVATFSTPGAPVLVAAPGVSIMTTDLTGADGYAPGDTAVVSGSSAAASIVSGVVALMLEANSRLGWRDVHEILALTARKTDPDSPRWIENAAHGANGGGLWTSRDVGFGLIDAHAAVRLAETWELRQTTANMHTVLAASKANLTIPDLGKVIAEIDLAEDIKIEHVELVLSVEHGARGDLRVTLFSPSGTPSVMLDRPGLTPGGDGRGDLGANIDFTFSSNDFLNESGRGVWRIEIEDGAAGYVGRVTAYALTAHGGPPSDRGIHVYTDSFATLGAAVARQVIAWDAGVDTINASAVTSDVLINLAGQSLIAGRSVSLAPGVRIEVAIGGDGDDHLIGDDDDNSLHGGRGEDAIEGLGGDDMLFSGPGSNTLDGGEGYDTAVFGAKLSQYRITHDKEAMFISLMDGNTPTSTDTITSVERFKFADVSVNFDDLFQISSLSSGFVVRAAGSGGPSAAPKFAVRVDGTTVGEAVITNPQSRAALRAAGPDWVDFHFDFKVNDKPNLIEIVYVNDGRDEATGEDLNLMIDRIEFAGQNFESEINGFYYHSGGVSDRNGPRETLYWNGILSFDLDVIQYDL